MAKELTLKPSTTYGTRENAQKAVERKFPGSNVRYIVVCDSIGRYYPVCCGADSVQAGAHFHFVTVA